ncbi:MAG TPA: YhdP family protein [Candidatus Saccharimonadia bacterium]|nr:YhdP family protein [Candidatus Saccharimonadia bacterium]
MTPSPTRRKLHRLRLGIEAGIACVVIAAALVIGAAGLLLPWLVNHPERVRAYLAAQLGRAVTIERVEGNWKPTGPVFTLHRVGLGVGAPFAIERAELALDFYAWLKRDISFTEFRIVGVAIDAVREPSGRWRVTQFGDTRARADGASLPLPELGSFSLRDARLSLTDLSTGANIRFAQFDARLVEEVGGRRLGGVLRAVRGAQPLRFACAMAKGALPQDANGRCYLEGRALETASWLSSYPIAGVAPAAGELDLRAWVKLASGRIAYARAEFATRGLVLRGATPVRFGEGHEIEPRHAPRDVAGAARFVRDAVGWRLDFVEDRAAAGAASSAFRVAARGEGASREYEVGAPQVDLARVAPLLALTARAPAALRSFAYENEPRGTLRRASARFGAGTLSLAARVDALALRPAGGRPGFGTLAGELTGDESAIVLVADPGQAIVLDHPQRFREPIAATLHHATLAAYRVADGWRVEASGFDLDGEDFGAQGSVALEFGGPGHRPFLDARVALEPGTRIVAGKRFWPIGVMSPKTVAWLDRALVAGVLLEGVAIVRGDLDDWPFRNRKGRFEARASFAAMTLAYHPEWPVARIEALDISFVDAGMDVHASAGEVLGNIVTDARAVIADFKQSQLELGVEAHGTGEDLLRLLRASPVARSHGTHLIGLRVGGTGAVSFSLSDELKNPASRPVLEGRVRLADSDLADAKYAVALTDATGTVRFGNDGFAADDLAARLDGDPVLFGIAVGAYTSAPEQLVEASLRGELPIRSVMAEFDALAPLHSRMPGRSEWTLDLAVPRDEGPRTLSLRSNLVGTALLLPAPLSKDAATALPVRVDVTLPALGGRLDLSLGNIATVAMQLPGPERELAADVAFGDAQSKGLPERGLRLHGNVTELDLTGWGGLAGGGAPSGLPIEADLELGALVVGGRRFDDVRLSFDQHETQHVAVIAGKAIAGRVVVPRGDSGIGVTAEFERLHVPDALPGTTLAALDPSTLPVVHFWAKDFRLGAARLGEARIEAVPFSEGLRFDTVETKSPDLEMRARGEWTRRGSDERSRFEIDFTAQSLGRMLDAFGFAGMIEGGQTYARLSGSWPGAPTRFSLASIEGTLSAKVGEGRMLDVNPGAGRFFGLLSVQSLPRRLSLDFSDFFKSGLAFDSIEGAFELRGGSAYTDGVVLKGPAAEIRVEGRTGLAVRDYDQKIRVVPRVGGVLPVVGAIAAGPAGVAAGLVANMLPLGQAARAEYRVKGSWDKPEITLIEKQRRGARG